MRTDVARAAWAATAVVVGRGRGVPLRLAEPLSFWGGYDSSQGCIVEPGHPQRGARLGARVLLMERAKGSSSSSSVLAEAIRNGTGPAAIVMRERDLIIGLGCIVASELYGLHVPVVVVSGAVWVELAHLADLAGLSSDGSSQFAVDAAESANCRVYDFPRNQGA